MDTLAVQLCTSSLPTCTRDFHPLERAHGAQTKKTPAQIGLRYLVQMNVSVIPRSTRADRIAENADLFDFELTDGEMQLLEGLDEQLRAANIPEDLIGLDLSH
jgi:diketogulonate reductase-like aldo/keto reductase